MTSEIPLEADSLQNHFVHKVPEGPTLIEGVPNWPPFEPIVQTIRQFMMQRGLIWWQNSDPMFLLEFIEKEMLEALVESNGHKESLIGTAGEQHTLLELEIGDVLWLIFSLAIVLKIPLDHDSIMTKVSAKVQARNGVRPSVADALSQVKREKDELVSILRGKKDKHLNGEMMIFSYHFTEMLANALASVIDAGLNHVSDPETIIHATRKKNENNRPIKYYEIVENGVLLDPEERFAKVEHVNTALKMVRNASDAGINGLDRDFLVWPIEQCIYGWRESAQSLARLSEILPNIVSYIKEQKLLVGGNTTILLPDRDIQVASPNGTIFSAHQRVGIAA